MKENDRKNAITYSSINEKWTNCNDFSDVAHQVVVDEVNK